MASAHLSKTSDNDRPFFPFDDTPFIQQALRDLDELVRGRQFHELNSAEQSQVLQRAQELKRVLWRQIPAVRISQSCSWCHEYNDVSGARAVYCSGCGHRGDLPRAYCDCLACINEAKGGAA